MNWKWLERNHDQFEAMKLCTAKWFWSCIWYQIWNNNSVKRKFKNVKKKCDHQPDLKTARAKQHINEVCEENISGSKNISVQFQKHMSCPDAIILWWLSIYLMEWRISVWKNIISISIIWRDICVIKILEFILIMNSFYLLLLYKSRCFPSSGNVEQFHWLWYPDYLCDEKVFEWWFTESFPITYRWLSTLVIEQCSSRIEATIFNIHVSADCKE